MRVIHFSEIVKGGTVTHLNELLPFQVEAYDHVAVFCPESQARLVTCPGVEVVTFPDAGRSPLGIAKLFRYWNRHIAKNRYDIIHLHNSFAGVVGRLGPRPKDAKIVYCSRGWSFSMDISSTKTRAYEIIERLLSRRTDAIINISMSEENYAVKAGIPKEKCTLVYNGIADAEWTPLPEGRHPSRLLFVGRYDRQKGIDVLVEAMRQLSGHGFTLTTIGEPVVGKPSVTEFPPEVIDLGWRTPVEIREAMAQADIVVMPSRWEGFGFVGAEAMRAGRPLVATAVGGLAELVVDGETGVLCAPNSVQSLVDAVLRQAEMELSEVGARARDRYEELFTSERMFRQIDAIYVDGNKLPR